MADDLKTMSGFVMGLLDRMDEDDVKYKGLIPGTNIPSVMSQFQNIPQGPQMVPDSPQLFRSQMTVPELEQFKVPEKSTPPIVPVPEKPYEGSKQYMQDYFSQNQSRLPDRDPVPPTVYTLDEGMPIPAYTTDTPKTQLSMEVPTFQGPVPEPYQDAGEYMRNYFSRNQGELDAYRKRKSMLRSDGTVKDQTGFLGPIPTDDGRVMTEQTIGVEIDGKEVNIPALVPGLDEYEIGLLASGTVDWNSIVGKGIKEKAVNHYKFRKSKGLDPYYKTGEVAPPYYLANTGSRIPKGILPEFGTFRDPSEYIPKPKELPSQKEYKDPSALKGKDLEYFIESTIASAGLPNTKTIKKMATEELKEFKEIVTTPERFGAELRMALGLPVRALTEGYKQLHDAAAYGAEVVADPIVRFTQGFMGSDVTGVDQGDFGRYYPDDKDEIPKVSSDGVPTVSSIPKVDEPTIKEDKKDKETDTSVSDSQVITSAEIEESGSKIPPTVKEQVDNNVKGLDLESNVKVVTKTNTETGEEEVEVVDENGNEKPGFFKSLWNGIKDIAKEGFEDPALRRALFAYTASRVLGYDGVTLAAGVLENEWKKQAAQAKADADLRKTMTKEQLELYEKSKPDYSKPGNIYNPNTRTNTKGHYNGLGQFVLSEPFIVVDSDGEEQKIPANTPLNISTLQSMGLRVAKEPGQTLDDLKTKFLGDLGTRAEKEIAKLELQLKQLDIGGEEKADLIRQMQAATQKEILREPLLVFLDTLPRSIDPTDEDVSLAAERGLRQWLTAIKDGRSVNNVDLASFLELHKMTLDIKSRGIPQSYFKFEGKNKNEELGLNAFAKIQNSVLNHPAIRDDLKITSYPEILEKLAVIYGEDVVNKPKFATYYKSQSEDSLKGSKSEYVTPFFAFVEQAFSSKGGDDLPALLERLKNIK